MQIDIDICFLIWFLRRFKKPAFFPETDPQWLIDSCHNHDPLLCIWTQVEEAWSWRCGMTRDRTSWLTFLTWMKADQAIHLNGLTLCQKYFHFIQTILAVEAEASLSLQRMETTCFISTVMTDVSSISVTPVAPRIRSVSVECKKMEWWLMHMLLTHFTISGENCLPDALYLQYFCNGLTKVWVNGSKGRKIVSLRLLIWKMMWN